jgi:hypothetical protein
MVEVADQPLVYNMGKVGSVAIQGTLRKKGLHTLHAHYLFTSGEFNSPKTAVLKKIQKRDRKWKIISLVREPVSRNVSAYFREIPKQKTIQEIVDDFVHTYPYYWSLLWFEQELNNTLEFNIYDYPFDHEKGYTFYKLKNVDLLVLRTEDLNRSAPEALEKLLDLEDVEMLTSNVTEDKGRVRQVYIDFKREAKFSQRYLDLMYNSKYTQHFYTKEEIAQFRARWSK